MRPRTTCRCYLGLCTELEQLGFERPDLLRAALPNIRVQLDEAVELGVDELLQLLLDLCEMLVEGRVQLVKGEVPGQADELIWVKVFRLE